MKKLEDLISNLEQFKDLKTVPIDQLLIDLSLIKEEFKKQLSMRVVSSTLLSVPYLMNKHPEINRKQAENLLMFCKEHTIRHKECYGDGSVMYCKWLG